MLGDITKEAYDPSVPILGFLIEFLYLPSTIKSTPGIAFYWVEWTIKPILIWLCPLASYQPVCGCDASTGRECWVDVRVSRESGRERKRRRGTVRNRWTRERGEREVRRGEEGKGE